MPEEERIARFWVVGTQYFLRLREPRPVREITLRKGKIVLLIGDEPRFSAHGLIRQVDDDRQESAPSVGGEIGRIVVRDNESAVFVRDEAHTRIDGRRPPRPSVRIRRIARSHFKR